MPRHARLAIPFMPLHIRQRGIDKAACFARDTDFDLYTGLLEELVGKSRCQLHAYVLMPNHVHLLLTGEEPTAASAFMKALAQRYSQYFNRTRGRTGPMWEGRFRSSPVESERYLLTLYRYIELNPVRAGLVRLPHHYRWSSFHHNALGAPLDFLAPHPGFLQLGASGAERTRAYLEYTAEVTTDEELAVIRESIDANAALGSSGFVEAVEAALGRRAGVIPRGRPRTGVPTGGKKCLSPV
jgi:putative transposase